MFQPLCRTLHSYPTVRTNNLKRKDDPYEKNITDGPNAKALNQHIRGTERASLQQLAFLVHKSAAFQSDSYERITKRMYPRMDQNKLMLIVELLEELDPRDASDDKPNRQTIDNRQYSEAYLDGLMKRLEPVATQPDPSENPKFDVDALIERVVSLMSDNKKIKNIDFSDRETKEQPLRDYRQYAADIDNEGIFKSKQEFIDVLKSNAKK